MKITILGTSSMVPTKERNVSATALEYEGECILFDCGEGTQRQMNICGIKRTSVTKIFITHWHGDHTVGLLGLIQTLGNNEDTPTIDIYGPLDTKKYFDNLMNACIFDTQVNINIHEFNPTNKEKVCETENYYIETAPLSHGIPCVGYRFVEKQKRRIRMKLLEKEGVKSGPHISKLQNGEDIEYKGKTYSVEKYTYLTEKKVFAYITDTEECDFIVPLAQDADLMIIEATYSNDREDKAHQNRHLTAKMAALLASNANVKKAVLTHFSQRYKNTQDIEDNARDFFDNIVVAEDFMRFTI